MPDQRIPITDHASIVAARQAGRETANRLGFGPADQTRLATAISELTRNAVQYADRGVCTISDMTEGNRLRLQVTVEDEGPGIPDIDRALEFGFSTGKGLGAGLLGAKRLVHDFHVESRPGYTRVVIALIRPKGRG